MENVTAHTPIYSFGDNGVELVLQEVMPFLASQPFRYRRVTKSDLVAHFRSTYARGSPSDAFLMAALILLESEQEIRLMVQKKINPKLRSIRLTTLSIEDYLRRAMCPRWSKGNDEMEDIPYSTIADEALGPVKHDLGLPLDNPVAYSYPITHDVILSATSKACQQHLSALATKGAVLTGQYEQVCNELTKQFPNDSAAVIKRLAAGKNREHLSAISLSAKGREAHLTIVNPGSRFLTFPALKFEALIEQRGSIHLGTIGSKTYELTKASTVEFKTHLPSGLVAAKFAPKSSTLYVALLQEKDMAVIDSAAFILDPDAVACHFLSLKRLHMDRQRFEELLAAAESTLGFDPFNQPTLKEK